ncbi:unnamed protein product [[Candida] boidinii]|nr:unnamed protein product [[Candida] boidinii]
MNSLSLRLSGMRHMHLLKFPKNLSILERFKMKLLNVYFVIATLFSVLANSSPIEKRDTTISILPPTTVPASASCTNISTDLPRGFSATIRTITPQWAADNGYVSSPGVFLGYLPDSDIIYYQYSGYLYAEQAGNYRFDFTFLTDPTNFFLDVYYGDDAGMNCCGDLSDSTVDWHGTFDYVTVTYITVTAPRAGIFVPVRIVSNLVLLLDKLKIRKPNQQSVAYTDIIYNGASVCEPGWTPSPSSSTPSASILPATTIPASASCTSLSTNLPHGFSSTIRIITPQWVVDNGYSGTLSEFAVHGYDPNDHIPYYFYSGYLYAPEAGDYYFVFQIIRSVYLEVFSSEDAGMDCCGDLSDYGVDWIGIFDGYATATRRKL